MGITDSLAASVEQEVVVVTFSAPTAASDADVAPVLEQQTEEVEASVDLGESSDITDSLAASVEQEVVVTFLAPTAASDEDVAPVLEQQTEEVEAYVADITDSLAASAEQEVVVTFLDSSVASDEDAVPVLEVMEGSDVIETTSEWLLSGEQLDGIA